MRALDMGPVPGQTGLPMDVLAGREAFRIDAAHVERVERALVAHTYRLMPTSMIGVAIPAMIFAIGAVSDISDPRIVAWLGLQQLALLANLGILVAYRRGRFDGPPSRARALQRLGVVLAGAVWGVGSVLWPLHAGLGPGFALVFCYAGMCAGGATTLAGDPVAYGLFAATAVTPEVVQSMGSLWWIAALLVAFVVLTTFAVIQNQRTLRESLSLRFENADLLDEAIREREAALAAHAAAERAAEAKSRFLAAASHDLRQPVQAMSLFVDVLEMDPDLDREARLRAVRSLGRSTDALRAMIEALLDVSRLDAGLGTASPSAVPLEPLFAEVIAALTIEAESKDMVLLSAGRATTVFADPAALARVVHNLAANAVRHGGRGRVLIAARRGATHARIQVWDQGEGIAPGDRDRIFEEFVQLGNRERDRAKGLGLGLPIVRRICARHGWDLTMRSTPGHGSVFTVAVPLATSPMHEDWLPRKTARDSVRVLLVEDDALVREASSSFLAAAGCVVTLAGDADEALAAFARLRAEGAGPDVLVTDHRLPGTTSGAELAERIAGAGDPGLPCVLLTGDVDDPWADRAPRPERVVLRKPVNGELLRDAIARVVATRPTRDGAGPERPRPRRSASTCS